MADRSEYLDRVREADLFLSTADHEFFGLSALEAIRSGLLPVLPDDLSYPELLAPGARRRPFLYSREEGCVPALIEALRLIRVGDEGEARSELVTASEALTWSAVAPRYDALFEECAATRE